MAFFTKIKPFLKARFAPRGARISFSESGEDIVMSNILKKHSVNEVFYIDIGAHDPVFGNNTYLFYKQKGHGILIEPNSHLCDIIRKKRPRDVVVNAGAGSSDSVEEFFLFSQSTRSTFSKQQASDWESASGQKAQIEQKVIISLDTVFNKYCTRKVPDIISMDAEGYDTEILKGFSWDKRPAIFCIENQNKEILSIMRNHQYILVAQVFQNAIFMDGATISGNKKI